MPHLTLRHSDNLKDFNFIPFFQKAHEILCHMIHVKPTSCSSMVISHQQYLIADGQPEAVFIHLDVLVKSGKDPVLLNQVSQSLLKELKNYLTLQDVLHTKVSVHVFETSYFSS